MVNMKLLVITQKVDERDGVLGFFHRWLVEFSKHFEYITVICLGRGEYHLPENVKVLSLGKERGVSKFRYLLNFYTYIWSERKNYDAVFVHMNQEYILLGWKVWKLLGKKIYFWRNHKVGNFLTRISVWVSDRVFCTSKGSFTSRFKKTIYMPVGVDSEFFCKSSDVKKTPNSILLLTRISPVKHVDVFIDALYKLNDLNTNFTAYIYGDPTSSDHEYFSKIKFQADKLVRSGKLVFKKGVPNTETPRIYNEHEIFVNLTDSGSFDKTIIEAMLCETLVLVSNESLKDLIGEQLMFKDRDSTNLAQKLNDVLKLSQAQNETLAQKLKNTAQKHSLENLMKQLVGVMQK